MMLQNEFPMKQYSYLNDSLLIISLHFLVNPQAHHLLTAPLLPLSLYACNKPHSTSLPRFLDLPNQYNWFEVEPALFQDAHLKFYLKTLHYHDKKNLNILFFLLFSSLKGIQNLSYPVLSRNYLDQLHVKNNNQNILLHNVLTVLQR